MPRQISPKRDSYSGDLYHYCPLNNDRTTTDSCEKCEFKGAIAWKTSKYVVTCNVPSEVELVEFEPPKAHDDIGPYHGLDVVNSGRHTWIEPKLDGARAFVHITSSGIYITSRRREKTGQFKRFHDNVPHIRDHGGLKALANEYGYVVLDGEIIVPKAGDTLAATMSVVGALPDYAIEAQKRLGLAQLHIFDIPVLRGEMTKLPLFQRRQLLEQLFPEDDELRLVPVFERSDRDEKVDALVHMWDEGYEGMVIKDRNAIYGASKAWLKVKERVTLDCQIVDWTPGAPGTKYEGTLGSLRIAVKTPTGDFHELADVIPGDDALRDELFDKYTGMTQAQIIAENTIVEVQAQCVTKDGALRHPRIIRWREDRSSPNVLDL